MMQSERKRRTQIQEAHKFQYFNDELPKIQQEAKFLSFVAQVL